MNKELLKILERGKKWKRFCSDLQIALLWGTLLKLKIKDAIWFYKLKYQMKNLYKKICKSKKNICEN